jgi:hypothetical protein
VQSAGPAVGLLGSTLNVGSGYVVAEEWGCDFQSPVPLAERVVYFIDRMWRSHVEGVVVVVCLVIRDESCEV